MGAMAWLRGADFAPPDRCRYLELGCGRGATLLALAQLYPESEFVGVDLAAKQVSEANEVAAEAGLANVRFICTDIVDESLDEWGAFDYVSAHGLYSWSPTEVRDRLLDLCGSRMSSRGLALVSYNTMPGWAPMQSIREMLIYHTSRFEDPEEKHRQAGALLTFLRLTAPGGADGWRAKRYEEIEREIRQSSPTFLLHDLLEEVMQPVFFHEFLRHIEAHGLQYISEVSPEEDISAELTPAARHVVEFLRRNPEDAEQYVDFARDRVFRLSLLRGRASSDVSKMRPERFSNILFRAKVRAVSQSPRLANGVAEEFLFEQGRKETASDTVSKALLCVFASARVFLGMEALAIGVAQFAQRDGIVLPVEKLRPTVHQVLQRMLLGGLLEISLPQVGRYLAEQGMPEKPFALPLARVQARRGLPVLTGSMDSVAARPEVRELLPYCDGTRTIDELLAVYSNAIGAGRIPAPVPIVPHQAVEPREALENLIRGLASGQFLWREIA